MKNLKRAVIIGEKTRGGAHDGEDEEILGTFIMHLPTGRAVNPITKTNWEGSGVMPDVAVPQQEALDRAQLVILEELVENETDETNQKIYSFALREIKAKLNPVEVNDRILKKYVGSYGSRKVKFKNGTLTYFHGKSSFKLIPLSETLFYVDGADDFQIEFPVLSDGSVKELIIVWDDGFRSHLTREWWSF
jgi:hypothetical protein